MAPGCFVRLWTERSSKQTRLLRTFHFLISFIVSAVGSPRCSVRAEFWVSEETKFAETSHRGENEYSWVYFQNWIHDDVQCVFVCGDLNICCTLQCLLKSFNWAAQCQLHYKHITFYILLNITGASVCLLFFPVHFSVTFYISAKKHRYNSEKSVL